MFESLRKLGYDIAFHSHAEAILLHDFPEVLDDIEAVLAQFSIAVSDLVAGGGGESVMTQRLRRDFGARHWKKTNFEIRKEINGRPSGSISHEVDHVRFFGDDAVALEIEWNNKDPFFDRDLENFKRLHVEGAIAAGVIVTRGASLQAGVNARIERFARSHGLRSLADVTALGLTPTARQRAPLANVSEEQFPAAWANAFCADKFGESTTHWRKLQDRVDRRVGHPCPLLLLGVPIDILTD